MREVGKGRDAVATVTRFLGTNLPFKYLHWVAFIVKMHNLTMCMSFEPNSGHWTNDLFKVTLLLLISWLLNAILLVAHGLGDPFSSAFASFPGLLWRMNLAKEFELMIDLDLDKLEKDIKIKIKGDLHHELRREMLFNTD